MELKYVILSSTGKHPKWRDLYIKEANEFIYYGDQDKPGKDILDTRKKGNEILSLIFEMLKKGNRRNIPSFFVFVNQKGRDVKFIGLAVPGSKTKSIDQCLEEITDSDSPAFKGSIKNYKSIFTILDISIIDRRWLDDLDNNLGYESKYAPKEWIEWIDDNGYEEIEAKGIIGDNSIILSDDIKSLDDVIKNIDNISFEFEYREKESINLIQSSSKVVNDNINKKSTNQYINEYIKKQYIGVIGEYLVYKHEKEILKKSEIKELREKSYEVEWSSKIYGDGLGYDIKSYEIRNGDIVEKYIEVKTTSSDDKNFEVTIPEVEKSIKLNHSGIYVVARVYNLDIQNRKALYYYEYGKIEDKYLLTPKSYIAIRKCQIKD